MLANLPAEITYNILHRLPVKTLIRCSCLSKPFFSLLTSRAFISAHIAHNTTSHFLLRYFTDDKQEKYHFDPDNDYFSGFQTQGLLVPFNDLAGFWFNIVGCVNGVVCLVNDCRMEGTRILLWNPALRKYVHVPEPHYVYHSYGPYESACGFGYDSVLDDYKVVRVVDMSPGGKDMTVYEVYSLKSGCWKSMGVCPRYGIKPRGSDYSPCSLHGSVHWVVEACTSTTVPENSYEILKFDMFSETFEIIKMPRMLKDDTLGFISVQECRGMLSVVFQGDNESTCTVWVMKEYGDINSWSKIFGINIRPLGTLRGFGLRKNGEVIIVASSSFRGSDIVVSIDPVTTEGTLYRAMINIDRHSLYLSTYVESMELFQEGKGIEDLPEDLKAKPRNTEPK